MNAKVSKGTEQALQAAMQRLLSGAAIKTDGRLTVANLAIEAGVSRATANRAASVLAEFRPAAAHRAKAKRGDGANQQAGEESRNAHILAQHIQARALYVELAERSAKADILLCKRRG